MIIYDASVMVATVLSDPHFDSVMYQLPIPTYTTGFRTYMYMIYRHYTHGLT